MDPDANLEEQLRLANALALQIERGEKMDEGDVLRLEELVVSLDEWISKGGFLPQRWTKK